MSEAAKLDSLNLGQAKSILSGKKGTPMEELLKSLCQDVSDQLVEALDSRGVKASLNLRQSIKPESQVTINGSEVTIGIKADFYWKYVNYGVNGFVVNHGAPTHGSSGRTREDFVKAISNWRTDVGMTLSSWTNADTGKQMFSSYEQLDNSLAFLVARNGQKPRPFYTDVVNDELVEYLRKPISDLLGRSIQINIVDPWQ